MVNRGKSDKGITILALVVTIIVLLILAGITLATLTGENGILTKAKTAKEEYKKAQYEEAINFAKLQAHTEQGKYKIDAEAFLKRVREILQKNELFKDARKPEENAEAWRIENKIDGDDNKWKLTIITAEDWDYYVTEENTKYIGIEEEIKTVIDKDIAFSYDDRWTQGPIIVTIEKVKPKEHEEYQIEYSYDEMTWQDYTTPIEIYKNQYIYARLTDNKGNNVTRSNAKEKITKIDKLKPEEFNINKDEAIITTDSITIMGETTDAMATEDYGQSGIETYQFSINGGAWATNKNIEQTSYTFTGLTQNTTYKIKMKAIDHAGNERKTEEIEVTTAGIPDLREEDEGSKRANVTFSHDPVGWTNGNVEVTIDTTEKGYILQYNIGDRNREEDWRNYDSPVVMTENGSIYARLKDNANNKGEAIEHKITNIERVKPTVEIQANTTAISQTKQITITARDTGGSELLDANYYQYYLSTSGAELLGGSWQNYTSGTAFTIGNGMTGTRYIWVKQIADNAGNKSETNNGSYHVSSAYTFDNTAPKCTITTNVNSPTNASSITYTFEWSETLANNTFTVDDITVTNGSKGTFTTITANKKYTLVVTNTGTCEQTISVPAGKCTDTAGNNNTEVRKAMTIDRTAPKCIITADKESPTNTSIVIYTFTWDKVLADNTFTKDDIIVTNGDKGTFTEIIKNKEYTLSVSSTMPGEYVQKVEVPAGKCMDLLGNGNVEASKTIMIDRMLPTCEITADVESPTNASSIMYTFTFSEEVIGFTLEDITVTNGTKGTFKEVTANKVYTLQVINGDLTDFVQKVKLESGTCMDLAGNSNLEASKTVTVDRTLPTCKITADVESLTNASSVMYTFTFSEEVTGFTVEDINVNKGSKGRLVPLSSSVYQLSITDTDHVEYNQIVSVAAGSCQDLAGNGNEAATKEIKIDRKAPECTITANVESPTNANSIEYSFTFTEPVTDFEEDDITVSNGVKGTLEFSRSLGKYILIVTNTGSCEQTISVKANSYSDMAGNYNTSSTSKTVIVDRTGPEIQINPDSDTTYTKTKTIGITVTDKYSNIKDITIEYGWSESLTTPPNLYKTLTYQTNNHEMNSFTFPLTNEGANLNGIHYLWVKPVVLEDVLGNRNTTIKKSKAFYFDNEAPEINASSDSNYSKMKNVIVTITDKNSGLASGGSVQYGWSESLIEAPSSYQTEQLTYQNGVGSIAFTAKTQEGIPTGKYYLWVKPINLKDIAGNNCTTIAKSTGQFYIDSTAPTIGTATSSLTIVAGNSGMISVSNIADTGGSGITGYYIKKQAPSETTAPLVPTANDSGWVSLSSSSFNYMLASATQSDEGRYYIWVKDGAGNVSGVKICQVTVQTAVAQVVGVLNGNRASVQDAIDTCLNAGQSTVKLLVNNQPTKKITVKDNEQIILDLNTKTLTGKIETQEGANITIQNGTMSATTDNVHVVYNMGTTTIKCKVEGRNDTSMAPIVNEKGTLTLGSRCTVTVYHSSNAIYTYGGQTIISGATIKGYSGKATIYNNGILTVNSGTCTGITAPAINNAASGTLKIKGGTLTSNSTTKATATVKNAGTTKFTKGTIRNTRSGGYAIYNTGSWTGKASATDGRVVSGNTSY